MMAFLPSARAPFTQFSFLRDISHLRIKIHEPPKISHISYGGTNHFAALHLPTECLGSTDEAVSVISKCFSDSLPFAADFRFRTTSGVENAAWLTKWDGGIEDSSDTRQDDVARLLDSPHFLSTCVGRSATCRRMSPPKDHTINEQELVNGLQ